jgi:O-antigen ligase
MQVEELLMLPSASLGDGRTGGVHSQSLEDLAGHRAAGDERGHLAPAAAGGALQNALLEYSLQKRGPSQTADAAQGRVFAWEVTTTLNHNQPLTGAGAFLAAWPVYAPPQVRGAPLVAHNIFLSEIGEPGLVGFFLMVIFVSSALSGAARALKDEVLGPLARGILSGLAGFLLCSMTSGYLLSAHLFFLAALAGSVVCTGARHHPSRLAPRDGVTMSAR